MIMMNNEKKRHEKELTQQVDSLKENLDEAIVSKTQLKKDAKALQDFGYQLTELPEAKLIQLPLSDTTLNAIRDFHKHTSNIAKKRHLAYIGKCLRSDDAETAKEFLQEDKFEQLRKFTEPKKASDSASSLEKLLALGETGIQKIIEQNPGVDRQPLRQLLRNISKAKTPEKKLTAQNKLKAFIKDNQIDLRAVE